MVKGVIILPFSVCYRRTGRMTVSPVVNVSKIPLCCMNLSIVEVDDFINCHVILNNMISVCFYIPFRCGMYESTRFLIYFVFEFFKGARERKA